MTDLSQLTTSLAQIAAAGGPEFPEHYELFKHKLPYGPSDWVEEMRVWSQDGCDAVYNHSACEDGVITYAIELCAWWGQEYAQGYRAVIMPWATKGFWWELQTSWGTSVAEGEADALIDTSIALIKAVAERVGVEG